MQSMRHIRLFLFAVAIAGVPSAHAATIVPGYFISQAPFGDWRSPYQDFCEEASIVMAAHFLWSLPITREIADAEMRIIQRYEELMFGGRSKDTSVDEALFVLQTLYGMKNVTTKIIRSSNDIKQELAAGRMVIAPAAGRLLKNPYFVPPGPLYHMLVIRGFDDEKNTFITNDPGTRRGNGLEYPQARLFDAIRDWNNGDVLHGEKRVIIVGR